MWSSSTGSPPIAEAEKHHPDLLVSYGSVTIWLWTHAAGGITQNDFILAAKIDRALALPTCQLWVAARQRPGM